MPKNIKVFYLYSKAELTETELRYATRVAFGDAGDFLLAWSQEQVTVFRWETT
jgi:hypothetical protein